MATVEDERWMRHALALAQQGVGRVSPNPAVGALVVRHGICVGEGFHPRAGGPHAETVALEEAGGRARGATLYVSLEPCCHSGRTPPCTDAVIQSGIRRVVSAMQDPDPRVEGKGHARLRDAGLDVTTDVLHDDGQRVNRAYIKWKRTARPLVTLKMALTLDGKAATRRGESRWISGESARIEGHRLRNTHDAIVVGVGTVLADDPMLTTRLPEGEPSRDPLRVVLDTLARTPLSAKVLHVPSPAQTVIACGEDADEDRVRRLEDHGAEVWKLPSAAGGVDIGALLARLGTRDVLSVLVEGGPTVHWSFVREAAADRVVAFVAPLVLGGTAVSGVGGVGFGRLAQAMRLSDWSVRRIGHDLCLEGDVAGGG